MVRCFPCALDFGQINNTFYKISTFFHFLNIILAQPPGGKSTDHSEFFLCFPTEIFEFSFDPWCKIGWSPGHLDRVFENGILDTKMCLNCLTQEISDKSIKLNDLSKETDDLQAKYGNITINQQKI